MAALRHPNVVMFMGLCLQPPCIVTEFCARGSLFDVLRKARTSPAFAQQLDWPRRLSMALDAAKVLPLPPLSLSLLLPSPSLPSCALSPFSSQSPPPPPSPPLPSPLPTHFPTKYLPAH